MSGNVFELIYNSCREVGVDLTVYWALLVIILLRVLSRLHLHLCYLRGIVSTWYFMETLLGLWFCHTKHVITCGFFSDLMLQ